MIRDDSLREVELAFLNAPFRADGWLAAMRGLAAVTGTRVAQLIGVGGPMALPLNLLTEYPHDPHGHIGNPLLYGPINWRINTTERPMTLEHEPHYRAYRQRGGTSMYDDAVSDLDMPYGCQSALIMDANGIIGVSLLRSSREGPCDAEVLDIFRRLVRQAQRAVRVQLAIGYEAAEMMLGGLADRPEATLLLNRFGHVCATTPAAEALFDHPQGLRLEGQGLRLASCEENRAFTAAQARLLLGDGTRGPVLHESRVGACTLRPGGRWRLFLCRLPALPHALGFEPHLAVTFKPLEG